MELICSCCMFAKFEGKPEDHTYNVYVEGEYMGQHVLCPFCASTGEDGPKATETTESTQAKPEAE